MRLLREEKVMGVKFSVHSSFAFDMYKVDFGSLLYGYIVSRSSSRIFFEYLDGTFDEIRGSDFKFDSSGKLYSGKITGYAGFDSDGTRLYAIDGISVTAAQLKSVAYTYDTADDHKLIARELSGNDKISGGNERDRFNGYSGNDVIAGKGGADILIGGYGKDTLTGGIGADRLYGGPGADAFVFTQVKDSSSKYGVDTIYDFTGSDIINLKTIDANASASGNNAFKFVGSTDFSGHAGELRFTRTKSDTYISGDVDGDRNADFRLHLDDAVAVKAGDFIL